ncbi:GLPGLI family protein [Hanstruepera ponticola]|uniref:GLPGLI family protein n=1 Tax=Hanstruepera ponticola TaxID=2042995 RepID=UPI000CF03F28|nr:GLPGLI family protein [Hanstruepera ponticola]
MNKINLIFIAIVCLTALTFSESHIKPNDFEEKSDTYFNSQNIVGKVTYKSHKKMKTLLDSTKYDKETIESVQGYFTKQFQKEYVLEFNKTKSLFFEKEKLDLNGSTNNSSDKLFKDFTTRRYVHKKELLGKVFSIQDTIHAKEWQIHQEIKNIGIYSCSKATLQYKKNDSLILVTAWFTTQIPIANGPLLYDGLPGLVLQVDDGNFSYLCTNVELQNESKEFKTPKGGKVVSQYEFDVILSEKSKKGKARAVEYLKTIESSRN